MNISNNYLTCPSCKNIFLKTHIKSHYQLCKHKKDGQSSGQSSGQSKSQSKSQSAEPSSGKLVHLTNNMLNKFFKDYEQLFYEYVNGKCVALVGPAQSIIGTNNGKTIDKFDIVVRLNKSIPLPSALKDDIGSKTDIIYNSLNTQDFPGQNNLNPALYKKYGVKFVCSSYPYNHNIFKDDILNYVYKYKFELPFKVMDDTKFKQFENLLGTRPYTGSCAIMELLSFPIKYLYITGLDFYQTKYYSEYRHISKEGLKHTKNSTIHQAKPQLDYLKHISLMDDRIILDGFLDKLLYNDYYKVLKHLRSIEQKDIYGFGDNVFKTFFEMRFAQCTFTKGEYVKNKNMTDEPQLIITDNKRFVKNSNQYCIFITNDKIQLNFLNNNLESKKFIGNYFYSEQRYNPASIYLTNKFLNELKVNLTRIGINNCNINLAILLSLVLYIPDKHSFSSNEIYNNWRLSSNEKKLILFMVKKKLINMY